MANGVMEVVYPCDFGRPHQLLLNKFFDPSIPYFDQSEASKYKMAARGPQMADGVWERVQS